MIIAFLLLILSNQVIVLAPSPIFRFQEINDPNLDWIDLDNKKFVKQGERSTDILSVDYNSNGNTLNSTIWLYYPFKSKPTEYQVLNYGMYIDADFNKKTGYDGIDYQLEIGWNNTSQTWTKTLDKWSLNGNEKTIKRENNYKGFFDKNKHYVDLSLDLNFLEYPSIYKIAYYAEAKKEKIDSLLTDFTKWVVIPPIQLTISTLPEFIELHEGEEKTIEMQINSSQGYEPKIDLSILSKTDNIKVIFNQNNTLNMPTYGFARTPLTVKAMEDSKIGPYTLILFANSTFPPEQLTEDITKNTSLVPPVSENTLARSDILVTILEPSRWDEEIKDLWNNIGGFASFFYGILAGLTPWIYNSIIKRKKGKNNK